jgi:hypothetical protein
MAGDMTLWPEIEAALRKRGAPAEDLAEVLSVIWPVVLAAEEAAAKCDADAAIVWAGLACLADRIANRLNDRIEEEARDSVMPPPLRQAPTRKPH